MIYRAARRTQIATTFVANQMLLTPPSPYIKALQVPAGMDVADNEIVLRLAAEDAKDVKDVNESQGCPIGDPLAAFWILLRKGLMCSYFPISR